MLKLIKTLLCLAFAIKKLLFVVQKIRSFVYNDFDILKCFVTSMFTC